MPRILRIRYIPQETIDISSDKIHFRDDRYLITSWKPVRPRPDIESGISCIFLEEGWKISAIINYEGLIEYWYCDIIDIRYDSDSDTLYLHDLLVDIIIRNDGRAEVVDLDELAEAFGQGLITKEQLFGALKKTDSLLRMIYGMDIPAHVTQIIRENTNEGCSLL